MRTLVGLLVVILIIALPAVARQKQLTEKDKEYWLIKEASLHKYPQSLKKFEEALRLNSNCAETYEARAKKHLSAGHFDLAISDCNRALDIDPDDEYSYLTRAQAFYFSGQYQAAIDDAKRFEEHDHGDKTSCRFQSTLIAGASYYQLHKFSEAISTLSKVERGDLGEICPDAFYYRGLAYLALGEPEKALSDLNVSIKTNKNIPEYYLARAKILAKMGKTNEATRDRKAASAVPQANKGPRYFLM